MSAPTPLPPPPAALDAREIRSVFAGIMLAMFLAALDQTIIATALPLIARDLGDVASLPWVATAYLLAATAVTPLYGKASDIYGRRVMLLVGIATFVLGSIVCALAPTMLVLILARGLQGLGGGGLISLAQTIIADIVSPRERGRYQVRIASVFLASGLAGPFLGGFLAQHFHWSAIFWINLPLGLLAFALTNTLLRKLPRHDRPHRLDFLGAALMALATTLLMLALNGEGARAGQSAFWSAALIGASAVMWVLFGLRVSLAAEPLVPLRVLANPVVRLAAIASGLGVGTNVGLTIYVPIYLQAEMQLSASQSGIALIPLMAGGVIGAMISGRTMARVRHYKRLPLAGLTVATLAMAALAILGTRLTLIPFVVILGLTALSLGTVFPVATVAIQNAVAHHDLGIATASMNFFRQLGGAILVAVYGAIVVGGANSAAATSVEELSRAAAASGTDLAFLFQLVFAAAAAGFAVALLAFAFMEERPLRGTRPGAGSAVEPH
ncbi:MAG: MDR family MFS transporter [Hyphomicrobiales bacterium]